MKLLLKFSLSPLSRVDLVVVQSELKFLYTANIAKCNLRLRLVFMAFYRANNSYTAF